MVKSPRLPALVMVMTVLEAALLLVAGISALLVSSAFCDASTLCATRGVRWFAWFIIAVAMLALALVILWLEVTIGRNVRVRVARIIVANGLVIASVVAATLMAWTTVVSGISILLLMAGALAALSAFLHRLEGGRQPGLSG